jgi:hypothetical protein
MRETKQLKFEIKEVAEDGTFVGLASTYGNVDLGQDVVEKGAFTKTIAEHGDGITILWQHDSSEPIARGMLEDSDAGLVLKGKLVLDLETAKKAYVTMREKLVKGLSIGFEAVKKTTKGGIRHLKEIKLYEVSVVTFPMNEQAMITAVKAAFGEELDRREKASKVFQVMSALEDAVFSTLWNDELDKDGIVTQIGSDVDEFKAALLAAVPVYLDLYGVKERAEEELKAGAVREETRKRIENEIEGLQALLRKEADATSEEADATSADGAATQEDEPVDADALHSLADSLLSWSDRIRGQAAA